MHKLLSAANLARHRLLLLLVYLLAGLPVAGCTTLQPVADNAVTLRDELRAGRIAKPGDRVSVVTRDGLTRQLIVIGIDRNTLEGRPADTDQKAAIVAIPIDDIVYMDGERFSAGKTAARTVGGGVALLITVIVLLIIVQPVSF